MSKFSERLKELMADRNIKSEELGADLKIDGSTVRRWIRGETSVFRNQLIQLSLYFNCPIDYLSGRTEYFTEFKPKECPPFIERVYEVLEEKGVSTYKLNKDTNIKFSYLTKWRRGTEPHLYSLIELADYLKCSLDYLIGIEDN